MDGVANNVVDPSGITTLYFGPVLIVRFQSMQLTAGGNETATVTVTAVIQMAARRV